MADRRTLSGRSALVTGSVGGIGNGMARALAEAGANVMLSGLEPADEIEPIRAQMAAETGVDVGYVQADLTDRDQIKAMIDVSIARFGKIDILVNNAVVRHFAAIENFPLEHWDRALAVNLSAALIATQMLLPKMREAGYGRIFNMTSVYGSRATAGRVDYVTTKTAIQGLTRVTALEVAGTDVSCHALTPGTVLTPNIESRIQALMAEQKIDRAEADRRFLLGKQPSGRFVRTESVAEMMLLLCGPAGPDMNGAILPIEGGWLAQS